MSEQEQRGTFEGWCVVELFGHNVIAGYVSEQSIGAAAFVRVDVPAIEGQEGYTKFFNGSAIYAMTPSDEATVRAAAERIRVRPVQPWIVPAGRRELPAPVVDEDDYPRRDEYGFRE